MAESDEAYKVERMVARLRVGMADLYRRLATEAARSGLSHLSAYLMGVADGAGSIAGLAAMAEADCRREDEGRGDTTSGGGESV